MFTVQSFNSKWNAIDRDHSSKWSRVIGRIWCKQTSENAMNKHSINRLVQSSQGSSVCMRTKCKSVRIEIQIMVLEYTNYVVFHLWIKALFIYYFLFIWKKLRLFFFLVLYLHPYCVCWMAKYVRDAREQHPQMKAISIALTCDGARLTLIFIADKPNSMFDGEKNDDEIITLNKFQVMLTCLHNAIDAIDSLFSGHSSRFIHLQWDGIVR